MGQGKISLGWPLWMAPNGPERESGLAEIRHLAALQDFMRNIYARSAQMVAGGGRDLYAGDTPPLHSDASRLGAILIALDDGVVARFPGWDDEPADFDPRHRPWYALARDQHGPQWGDPYLSIANGPAEMPLSVPLYGERQRFLGVVSAAFMPDLMIKSLFDARAEKTIRALYLLDANGQILAAVGETIPLQQPVQDQPLRQLFPSPDLLARIKTGQTGVLETRLRGKPVVIAFDDVAPFGWSLAAVADPRELFKRADAGD